MKDSLVRSESERADVRRQAGILLALASVLLGACAPQGVSFLTPGGPVAQSELSHFFTIAAISLVAILPVLILTPLIVWRYRRRGGTGNYAPRWDYSRALELAMWGVPALIVAVLATQLVRNTLALDPYRPLASDVEPLRVDVVALNWKWLFILPDHGIATVDDLAVPVGVPIVFRLTSDTVMQSFMVGALAGQIYVMPGMETRQVLMADRQGVFKGRNTQYNGSGFAAQRFVVKALPGAEFDAWVASVRGAGRPLDASSYAILAAPSSGAEAARMMGHGDAAAIRFAPVAPDLFAAILHRYMGPRAVAAAEQPGTPGFATVPTSDASHTGHARPAGAKP